MFMSYSKIFWMCTVCKTRKVHVESGLIVQRKMTPPL